VTTSLSDIFLRSRSSLRYFPEGYQHPVGHSAFPPAGRVERLSTTFSHCRYGRLHSRNRSNRPQSSCLPQLRVRAESIGQQGVAGCDRYVWFAMVTPYANR